MSDLLKILTHFLRLANTRSIFNTSATRVSKPHPIRTKFALTVATIVAWVADKLGLATGTLLKTKIALKLHPYILSDLTRDKRCILITGSIGTTTTAAMVASAMRTVGNVVYTTHEDCGEEEVIAALLKNPKAMFAVLGVNELKFADIAEQVNPTMMMITNLVRDMESGDPEYSFKVHDGIQKAIRLNPRATVVGNCDNPLVVYAMKDARRVIWVNAGCSWKRQTMVVPYVDEPVVFKGETWYVPGTDMERPTPRWTVDKLTLIDRQTEQSYELPAHLTGRFYASTAGFSAIAADLMGVNIDRAIYDLARMEPYVGRTANFTYKGRDIRLVRTRSPQAFQQSRQMIGPSTTNVIVYFDCTMVTSDDASWLWDTDFSEESETVERYLREDELRSIIVSGQLALELGVVFTYNNIPIVVAPDMEEAIALCEPGGEVEVITNDAGFINLERTYDEQITYASGHRGGPSFLQRTYNSLKTVTPGSVVKFLDSLIERLGGTIK